MLGGRIDPVFGFDARPRVDPITGKIYSFPAMNTPSVYEIGATNDAELVGTANEFGTEWMHAYDADDRIERFFHSIDAQMRDAAGTPVGASINLLVGEQMILTFYSDPGDGFFGNLISWTNPAGAIITRTGSGMEIVIEGAIPGSGTLSVTGWPGTSDSVSVTIT